MGEGEETAAAWGAAQPPAHQTHPHILSVSRGDEAQKISVIFLIQILRVLHLIIKSVFDPLSRYKRLKIMLSNNCGNDLFSFSVCFSAGQREPNQVQFLEGCVKTSPGLRVMDSYAPLMEERTSLSTSLSE